MEYAEKNDSKGSDVQTLKNFICFFFVAVFLLRSLAPAEMPRISSRKYSVKQSESSETGLLNQEILEEVADVAMKEKAEADILDLASIFPGMEIIVEKEESTQQAINKFLFWSKMKQIEQNLAAQKLMEEVVKAEKEEYEAFLQMQQSRVEEWQKEKERQEEYYAEIARIRKERARKKAEAEARRKAEEARKKAEEERLAADIYLLAQIIFCESGCTEHGQSSNYNDMVYAGCVILNRRDTKYRAFAGVNTIRDVLYQSNPKQYSLQTIRKIEGGIEPPQSCLKVAKGLLNGSLRCLPECVLYQTTTWQSWMAGQVKSAGLNAKQFYGIPLDY